MTVTEGNYAGYGKQSRLPSRISVGWNRARRRPVHGDGTNGRPGCVTSASLGL